MTKVQVVTTVRMGGEPSGDTERVLSWLRALESLGIDFELNTVELVSPKLSQWNHRNWAPAYVGIGAAAKFHRWTLSLLLGIPPWILATESSDLRDFLRTQNAPVILLGGGSGHFAHSCYGRTHWDVVNVLASSSAAECRQAKGLRKLMLAVQAVLSRTFESRTLRHIQSVSVTTHAEATRLADLYGRVPDNVIPSIAPLVEELPGDRKIDWHKVLWLGSFAYSANWEGLLRFLDASDARLHSAQVRLLAVGSNLEKCQAEWLRSNYKSVEVIGFAEDLAASSIDCAAICIPLWTGAGLKIKTITAASLGLPIVGTSQALEGFPPEAAACLSDDPLALAEALIHLSDLETTTPVRIASNFVRAELSFENFQSQIQQVMSRCTVED